MNIQKMATVYEGMLMCESEQAADTEIRALVISNLRRTNGNRVPDRIVDAIVKQIKEYWF